MQCVICDPCVFNQWLSHCDACFHVVSEPLTWTSTQLRGSVQQAMGVYIDGKGAAITTSMKVWHLNRRGFLPGQAGQGMFTHRLWELLLRLFSRFGHCGPNLPNPTIIWLCCTIGVPKLQFQIIVIFHLSVLGGGVWVWTYTVQIHLHSHTSKLFGHDLTCFSTQWLFFWVHLGKPEHVPAKLGCDLLAVSALLD